MLYVCICVYIYIYTYIYIYIYIYIYKPISTFTDWEILNIAKSVSKVHRRLNRKFSSAE